MRRRSGPDGVELGFADLGAAPTGSTGWPPGSWRWACSPRTGSRSPPPPGSSGSWPTSPITCAGAARPPRSTPRPAARGRRVILADSGTVVVFAEDDGSSPGPDKSRCRRCRSCARVLTIDGTGDGDRVLPGRARATWPPAAADAVDPPDACDRADRRAQPRAAWPPSSTPPAPPAGPKGVRLVHDDWTYEGAAVDTVHPARRRPAVPVAAAVPRLRQDADRDPAADRLRHRGRRRPRPRSSRTWASCSRRSWPARPGSSRRCYARSR